MARTKITPKFGCNRWGPAIGTQSQRFRLKPAVAERYSRQILFDGIGKKGQLNISRSFAVVVGAGAIGSAAAEMLIRAGIGRIRIIDKDFVELSNLQRQSLFIEEDIGKAKAQAAAEKLAQINSGAHVEPIIQEFSPENAESLVSNADVVLDATDNMETRFAINDVCAKVGKPWIFAGAAGGTCMSMFVVPGKTPCLRCIFRHLPSDAKLPTAHTIGIASMTAHAAACLEVSRALNWLANGKFEPGLVYFDVWGNCIDTVKINRDKNCQVCGGKGNISITRTKKTK